MPYIRSITALIVIMFSALLGYAQSTIISASSFISFSKQPIPRSLAATPFAASQLLSVNAAHAEQLFMKASTPTLVVKDFPLAKNTFATLNLQAALPVIDGETHIFRKTKNGMEEVAKPAMIRYKGTIAGDEKSAVTLVYTDGELYAVIQRGDGTQMQIVPSLEPDSKGAHLMSQSKDMGAMPFQCYADVLPEYHRIRDMESVSKGANSLQGATLKEVELALEADHYLYARLGKDIPRIIKYIDAIFAVVSNKYEEEVNVTFHINQLVIYTDTDPDPYTANANGDLSRLLGEMQDYWSSNNTAVRRDIAHLLSSPGLVGNVGGIAFLQGLCSKDIGYSVSGIHGGANLPLMTYIWDSFVVTHEIGHNFSAQHTHDCSWNPPLDSCVNQTDNWDACWTGERKKSTGSIMSYCHLYSGPPRYTFLPRVQKVISDFANTRPCVTTPAQPIMRIVFPLGGDDQNYRNDTTLTVRWTSAKVNSVNVEYSLDSGKVWKSIANGVAATAANTAWTLPLGEVSDKCLVRVYDATNQEVGDTSYASFSLGTAAIALSYPVGGEHLPAKGSERIEWSAKYVRSFNVDFSPTGTEPWTRLATAQAMLSVGWTIPDIRTSQAKIRVTDASNGALISESAAFSIGTPTLELQYPSGGEEFCAQTECIIRWQSDFVKTIRIDLSTDGGKSYPFSQHITNAHEAKQGVYAWSIPVSRIGNRLRMRVVNVADVDMLSEAPADFIVKDCLLPVPEMYEAEGMEILSLQPNPASGNIRIAVRNSTGKEREAICRLSTADGSNIMLGKRLLLTGEASLDLSLSDIVQGSYIFVLEVDGNQLTIPLVIVR